MLTFIGDDGWIFVVSVVTFSMHSISLAQYNSIVETIRTEAPLGFDQTRRELVHRLADTTDLPLRLVQGVCSSWLGQANRERERNLRRDERQLPIELYRHLQPTHQGVDLLCEIAQRCQRQPYHVIKSILYTFAIQDAAKSSAKAIESSKLALRTLDNCKAFLATAGLSNDEEAKLYPQIVHALRLDAANGPYHARLTSSIGIEYEYHLKELLKRDQISYLSEDTARLLGHSITPDFRFVNELILKGSSVSWIDSKASFGDPASIASALASQFGKYVRSYGAGAVIYWFGYVASVPTALLRQHELSLPDGADPEQPEVDTLALCQHHHVLVLTDYPTRMQMAIATAHHKRLKDR
eukprot:m.235408 g.235408  ORF g.235408 m.235408 type:complete len:354 (+) comp17403_c0_seq2:2587-3648(+)